jgi:hypothetical protein
MARPLEFRVVGLDRLERRLQQLPTKVANRCLRRSLTEVGRSGRERLRGASPRATGYSAGKINYRVRVTARRGAYVRISWYDRPGSGRIGALGRMRFSEYGNPAPGRRQRARPFFNRAAAEVIRGAAREVYDGLKAAVEREEG